MTPEERGINIAWLNEPAFNAFAPHIRSALERKIAETVQEAENAALERAAKKADGFIGCDNLANDIRSLKHKDV